MTAIQWLYDTLIRKYLPKKISVYNTVPVRDHRLLDINKKDTVPKYEEPLIDAIRLHVNDEQDIVLVGGGWGVSSVIAARWTSENVTVYEGSEKQIRRAKETIRLNNVDEKVQIKHAVVANDISTWGDVGDAEYVNPTDIGTCNVLVLDCEGAEEEILQDMNINPETIIVETHEHFDVPKEHIEEILQKRGYQVMDCAVEDESKGVYVLTAVLDKNKDGT